MDALPDFTAAEFVNDPVVVMRGIDYDAQWLDWLGKALDHAVNGLDRAEAAWDEVYDKVADDLKEQMDQEGRKGDPAAHWIETQARKENRVAYQNLRRAKRLVEKLNSQVKAVSHAMNGRQSELSGLRDEARAAQAPGWSGDRGTVRR